MWGPGAQQRARSSPVPRAFVPWARRQTHPLQHARGCTSKPENRVRAHRASLPPAICAFHSFLRIIYSRFILGIWGSSDREMANKNRASLRKRTQSCKWINEGTFTEQSDGSCGKLSLGPEEHLQQTNLSKRWVKQRERPVPTGNCRAAERWVERKK